MSQIKEGILSSIQMNKKIVLAHWKEKLLKSPNNVFNEWIETRIGSLFDIFLNASTLAELEKEKFLQKAAIEFAEEINYNPDLVHFLVQNISSLKTEMANLGSKLPNKEEKCFSNFMKLNSIADSFIFYLLKHLTESEQISKDARKDHEDRLTLLGQMTASFVHEFRNPLTTVDGFIQLIRSDRPDLPYLDIIQEELNDLKVKITQFLMLSKKEKTNQERIVFSLSEQFDQILSFIYPKILESNVQLDTNFNGKLYTNGYAEEIKQVLINIIFNAIEAMVPHVAQPVIKVTGFQAHQQNYIKIANTGPKIPESIVETIFDPFFTTKHSGTGLGLYVCKEIIDKHNGKLTCSSDHKWTEFTIILPAF